ncbi:MAG: copper resistance protein CopC/CopD [Acidimicrobiales bacterium]|nr:CopD family protein [Acidimicrobiia bacterium]NNF53026.1 copper resistance protein CopC/CopD [Acidimicrobiales bacterium]
MILARRTILLVLAVAAAVIGYASPASAHTGFESSTPADGATVVDPLTEINLVFSGEAEPTGSAFEILDAAGQLRTPTSATTVDGLTWSLSFDPPLAGGTFGFRWMVKAPDAHPIDGSFSFTVTAPATSDAATRTPTLPAQETVDLETFLASGDSPTATAEWIAAAARTIGLAGAMVGIGALVFAAAVLRGARADIRFVLYWVRRGGALLLIGAVVELVAQVAVAGGGTASALWSYTALTDVVLSSLGIAIGLRAVGGFALATGARLSTTRATEAADPIVAIKELAGVGAGPTTTTGSPFDFFAPEPEVVEVGEPYLFTGDRAWSIDTDSARAFLGAAVVLASFIFDGHTVSKGNRMVTGFVDIVHVAGAAVWAGGVIMLAAVLWRRHRRNHELRTLQLAVRFSVVASAALAAVGVAGLILAVIVLDSPAELWQTPWGRLLIAKTVLVAVAVAGGGYNHVVLIPQLNAAPTDPDLSTEFRAAVTIEAAVLGAVVIVTAFLVAAAS